MDNYLAVFLHLLLVASRLLLGFPVCFVLFLVIQLLILISLAVRPAYSNLLKHSSITFCNYSFQCFCVSAWQFIISSIL
ncbi:hypothetical protein C2G38_2058024 [Gigaspora rosea]|uniref:Uncharacterized protein n=1 Tax=Gigaspora rosea TaxID=44941 RepID=A0A397W4G4_9GLOM|nr:hypothetical protein C2G38_2058024 [Gigaspora rosea]